MLQEGWTRYSKYIAARAKTAMKEQGMTQNGLAERMGRTQQYVSHILNGKENLTLETICLLDKALGISVSRDLFFSNVKDDLNESTLNDVSVPYGGDRNKSALETLASSAPISRRFDTGDRPFLVTCEDSSKYLCKATRFGERAYGLARELIGTSFAAIWGLVDASMALVRLLPQHSDRLEISEDYSRPCLGRRWEEQAVEINDASHSFVAANEANAGTMLRIALFDMWLSNEDRLNNNLNLLYSFRKEGIQAIDHAGIFNTGFTPPLMLLSREESIMYSNLFMDIAGSKSADEYELEKLYDYFHRITETCAGSSAEIWGMIPSGWGIDKSKYDSIMEFLFSCEWIQNVQDNFKLILNECRI